MNLPQTVNSPRVTWASGRVGIPELGLQQGTTRVVVAASWGLGRALAAQGAIVGAGLQLGDGTSSNGSQSKHSGRHDE